MLDDEDALRVMRARLARRQAVGRAISVLAILLPLVAFTVLFVRNAWVVDDAYITFRTVENFVHGRGLTWNVAERVQAYTHPLWMFLVSGAHAITGALFFTVLALSYLACLGALLLCTRGRDPRRFPLLVLLLLASKAFMDYTTSGLENALSYLLAAAFCATLLSAPRRLGERRLLTLVALTALAFVNRMDTVLLFFPALAWVVRCAARDGLPARRIARLLALGSAPAVAWLGFSLFYYGYPFPNTYYAKAAVAGLPAGAALRMGASYFANSLAWDPITLVLVAGAIVAAVVKGDGRRRACALGLGLYLAFVLKAGAAGTHMSGRFFAVPYFVAVVLLAVDLHGPPRAALAIAGAAVLLLSPSSSLWANTRHYQPPGREHQGTDLARGIADIRLLATGEGAGLLTARRGVVWPDHAWLAEGFAFRRSSERVRVGGAAGGLPIGFFGFGAGPDKIVIDVLGLSDPLLARLPVSPHARWGPGHFLRDVPAGYVESMAQDRNLIVDPDVHAAYDRIRLLTRGPLWQGRRLVAVVAALRGR